MLEILNAHLSEFLIGFFTILGVLIPTIYNYCKDRKDRKDKYFFAMIEKRFEIYSEASNWCDKLKHFIHEPEHDEEKNKQIQNATEWFSKNNLYLEPMIRKSFSDYIHEVRMYYLKVEEWRSTGQQKGWNQAEVDKKNEELKESFKEIMVGLQLRIQATIDTYYAIIKK